jgi:DNA-binding transcriptional LysR family regulator
MNVHSVDLNLLTVFDAIFRERRITVAAERLGLSQPATSNALTRLRRMFDDPLFVRTLDGMVPTPFAQQLAEPIRRACDSARTALQLSSSFIPRNSSRTFTLCMSDIGEHVFLPPLLRQLRSEAPNVNVKVAQATLRDLHIGLESGDVDLAIGLFPDLPPGFYQQRLYLDRLVCVARKDHPAIASSLSLRTFLSLPHAQVRSLGTGHFLAVEKAIGGTKDRRRRIALSVPHFLGLARIIGGSELIATIPERLAHIFSEQVGIRILEPPFHAPPIEIKQHWHERYHHDPANRWLRNLLARLFMSSESERQAATPARPTQVPTARDTTAKVTSSSRRRRKPRAPAPRRL